MYIKENDQFTESDTINQFFTDNEDNEPRMCCECGSRNIENGECQDCKVNIFVKIWLFLALIVLSPFILVFIIFIWIFGDLILYFLNK